ncbi:hypothetical protein NDU88_004204 [Pleurodeles waltl]|uniref:Uncharacterized protein n=1 Tax=Pleurodeles waltl TaxID=8319 RepID=A0AAV7WR78_PLEWA|nr:hypothetical protein NDU88_004204 [Pleurodeles waltl]
MPGGPIVFLVLLAPPRGVVPLGPLPLLRVVSCRFQGLAPVRRKGGPASPPPASSDFTGCTWGRGSPGPASAPPGEASRFRPAAPGFGRPGPLHWSAPTKPRLPALLEAPAPQGEEGRKPAPEPTGRFQLHARPGSRTAAGRHPGTLPSPAVALRCCVTRGGHAYLYEF